MSAWTGAVWNRGWIPGRFFVQTSSESSIPFRVSHFRLKFYTRGQPISDPLFPYVDFFDEGYAWYSLPVNYMPFEVKPPPPASSHSISGLWP